MQEERCKGCGSDPKCPHKQAWAEYSAIKRDMPPSAPSSASASPQKHASACASATASAPPSPAHIVGICEEMCSREEQLRRQLQNRLCPMEIDNRHKPPNSRCAPLVDRALAVKEFTRPAAGKERPLPAQVRPLHVLRRTMDHLVLTVLPDERFERGETYSFVADRIRAIMQDIHVQGLCSPETVSIVEDAARFFIFASYTFASGVKAFDPALNQRQLRDCLNTLQQWYRRLRAEGVDVPHESTFCAYTILLADEPDALAPYLRTLPPALQHAAAPGRLSEALEAIGSADAGLYHAFFRAFRAAAPLDKCLLARHVARVRVDALITMCTAVSHKSDKYTLADLASALAFDNDTDAARAFVQAVGLVVTDGDEPLVVLQRDALPGLAAHLTEHAKLGVQCRAVDDALRVIPLETLLLGRKVE